MKNRYMLPIFIFSLLISRVAKGSCLIDTIPYQGGKEIRMADLYAADQYAKDARSQQNISIVFGISGMVTMIVGGSIAMSGFSESFQIFPPAKPHAGESKMTTGGILGVIGIALVAISIAAHNDSKKNKKKAAELYLKNEGASMAPGLLEKQHLISAGVRINF